MLIPSSRAEGGNFLQLATDVKDIYSPYSRHTCQFPGSCSFPINGCLGCAALVAGLFGLAHVFHGLKC